MPPSFGVAHYGCFAAHIPSDLDVVDSPILRGVVFIESVDPVEHIVALIASLSIAGILEPILPGVILGLSLVHSVPPEQISNMVSC